MGRHRRRNRDGDNETQQNKKSATEEQVEPLARLVAVHPLRPVAAVAVGTSVRICDYTKGKQFQLTADGSAQCHTAALHLLVFSPDGKLLLTGGDDKCAKLWDTNSWQLIRTWKTPKKVCAGAFSGTSEQLYAVFADKFGDVLCGDTAGAAAGAAASAALNPVTLLGHFSAIVTSVAVSHDSRYIASADKDFKVRVSELPTPDPTKGSFQIQSYCMGHTAFVTSVDFVPHQQGQSEAQVPLLVSAGGDGTVRVWDYLSGKQLSSYVASEPDAPAAGEAAADALGAQQQQQDEEMQQQEQQEEEDGGDDAAGEAGGDVGGGGGGGEPERENTGPSCAPVLSVAVSPDGKHVAVAVEGEDDVQVLALDASTGALAPGQRLRLPATRYPCQVSFDTAGQLWVLGGVPLPTAQSAHLGVALRGDDGQYTDARSSVLCHEGAVSFLESRAEAEESQLMEGGALSLYRQHLRKKRQRQRTFTRNDLVENERLRRLREQQDAAAKQAQARQ